MADYEAKFYFETEDEHEGIWGLEEVRNFKARSDRDAVRKAKKIERELTMAGCDMALPRLDYLRNKTTGVTL